MGMSVGQPQPLTRGYGGSGADRHRQAQAADQEDLEHDCPIKSRECLFAVDRVGPDVLAL
jgi:hypothetical protein